jgi:hypothetical protein
MEVRVKVLVETIAGGASVTASPKPLSADSGTNGNGRGPDRAPGKPGSKTCANCGASLRSDNTRGLCSDAKKCSAWKASRPKV